jgi:Sulfotransferase family
MTVDHGGPVPAGLSGSSSPVFILCGARSGSTLLRYILDAHPDLACPAETGLPQICAQLAAVWSAIYGLPRPSAERGVRAEAIPDSVIAEVRRVIDLMIAHSLADRGKPRFVDKSLGAAKCADLLVRLYPQVKFVCLVRHPMDFIMSAVEASPWGPIGYGFDEYVTGGSGNMVRAFARYWIDHTAAIRSAATRFPGNSCMLRYEDLVDAPELVVSKVFEFLGVSAQPGITQRCLQVKQGRLGQGDHKIWWKSEITSESVGRGESVPPNLLTAPVRDQMNTLLDQLGYIRIDKNWGTPDGPVDPRVPETRPPVERRESRPEQSAAAAGEASDSLEERLRLGLGRIDGSFRQRWPACASDTFACVARPLLGTAEARWLINLARGVMSDGESGAYQWCITGEPDAWEAVLSGQLDLGSSVRRGELRYCEGTSTGQPVPSSRSSEIPITEDRVDMVGDLLGLTPWLARTPDAKVGDQLGASQA